MRIARNSGLPPSVIEETWSASEVLDVSELDFLEGAGQAKRLVARLCAEIHNACNLSIWKVHGKEGTAHPKLLTETEFLPVRKKASAAIAGNQPAPKQAESNMHNWMMSICGY